MFKRTQAIRWQKSTNFLCVFDHFVGLALKGLKTENLCFPDVFRDLKEEEPVAWNGLANPAANIFLQEAATGGVLKRKMFLNTSQNSQENACGRVFF